MRKKYENAIRDAVAQAFAAKAQHQLNVAMAGGWKFPGVCDVAVKVIKADALEARVHARIDDVGDHYTLSVDDVDGGVSTIVDKMVKAWLEKKGTPP